MKSLRIIFLLTLSVFVIGEVRGEKPQKPRGPASMYKTTAKIELQAQKLQDSAVVILEEGVHFYPNDAEMHFLLGKAYAIKNNYQGLGEQFAMADSLKKGDAKWVAEMDSIRKEKWGQVYNQGAKAFNDQNLDTAIVKFICSTIINPTYYKGFLYTGYSYMRKGQNEEALPYFQKAVALEPDSTEVLGFYADALLRAGKRQEALEFYNKILEKDPKNTDVMLNLVSIYSSHKDYDQALSYCRKLIEVDSTYKDGYFNLGDIYLHVKLPQIEEALDSLKDSSGVYFKDEKSTARIKELTQKKNELLISAQTSFEKVFELDTTDLQAQYFLTETYIMQDKLDQAMKILEPLVQKDSTNCDALNQLAIIYAKKGVGDKAKTTWQKAQDCLNRPK